MVCVATSADNELVLVQVQASGGGQHVLGSGHSKGVSA